MQVATSWRQFGLNRISSWSISVSRMNCNPSFGFASVTTEKVLPPALVNINSEKPQAHACFVGVPTRSVQARNVQDLRPTRTATYHEIFFGLA